MGTRLDRNATPPQPALLLDSVRRSLCASVFLPSFHKAMTIAALSLADTASPSDPPIPTIHFASFQPSFQMEESVVLRMPGLYSLTSSGALAEAEDRQGRQVHFLKAPGRKWTSIPAQRRARNNPWLCCAKEEEEALEGSLECVFEACFAGASDARAKNKMPIKSVLDS